MSDRRRWLGLPFIALGVALIIVDATIVNVAIPSIFTELKITSTEAQWTQESYTLVFASLLLVFGRLADRFGRRRLFVLGILVFAGSSILVATAQSGTMLIASRLLQGVGGAMMLPNSLSLLNSTFRGKDRAAAFAVWGATIGAAAAFGPLLGGWLTTSFSWRWAFGINIPLGAVVLIGILAFIDESRSEDGRTGADFTGAILSVLGIGSIVFGLIEGRNYGWWTALSDNGVGGLSVVPLCFAAGIALLVLMVWVELRRNRADLPVLLDLQLLGIKSFRNANIAAAIVSLGEFGLLFALPLWLQNVLGYSAFDTGLILMSLAAGSFLASGVGAPLGNKIGPVAIVRAGLLLELIGIAIAGVVISSTTSWQVICVPLFIYGAGVGLATAQLTGVALMDVPVAQSGQGSGITSTSRQLGSALGIALLGTVLFSSFGASLDSRLQEIPGLPAAQAAELRDGIVASAGTAIPALRENAATAAVADAASEALSEGTRLAAYAGAAFLLLGWLAALSLGKSRPVEVETEPAAQSQE